MDETFDNGRIRHAEIVRDGLPPGTWLGALRVAVVVEGHLEQAPEALLTKAVNSGSVGVGMSDVIRCQMSDVRCQMYVWTGFVRDILPDGGIDGVSRILHQWSVRRDGASAN